MVSNFNEELNFAFTKQSELSGKEKAAILFAELGMAGTANMLQYFSNSELKKLRKALANLPMYNWHQVPRENRVLEEACRFGMAHRICNVSPELLSSAHYSKLHENDSSNNFMKNLTRNPDAVANVLAAWLREDK